VGVMMVGLVAEVPCGWVSVVAMIVVYLSVCLDWKTLWLGTVPYICDERLVC